MDEADFEKKNQDLFDQELWIVKDDPENSRWEFICKPMYDLKVKDKKERVTIRKM